MENVGQHTLYFPSNCLDSTVLRSRPLFQVAAAQILRFLELQKSVAQKFEPVYCNPAIVGQGQVGMHMACW